MTTATLNTGRNASPSTLLPTLSLIGAMASLCIGTSFAKSLFPLVGAQGTTAYRIAIGALILLAFWRPWRFPLTRRDAGKIALYGVTLACLNLLFYMALRTLPLGVAIAIEFTGPLTLAVALSRRAIDFVWIACAAAGLVLLIPTGQSVHDLDPVGIAYALGAAVCWALYILFGQRAGADHGAQGAALGVLVAAILVVPIGVAHAGADLLDPALIPLALGVAVLSTALPYTLEMVALTESGHRLAQPTKDAFGQLRTTWALAPAQQTLSITTLPTFATNWLVQRLGLFQLDNPEVAVRLDSSERVVDFAREDFDVAIRYGAPADSSLVALPLAPDNRRVLCAAPGYLAERGEPRQPDDLREHNCLLYQLGGRVHDRWAFQRGRRSLTLTVAGDRVCDDADVVRRWALADKGLVYKSWLDVAEDVRAGRLRLLLPEWQGEATPMNLLCTHRAQLTRPVTLLRAFVRERCDALLAEAPWTRN